MKPVDRKHDVTTKTLSRKFEYLMLVFLCWFIWRLPYKGIVYMANVLGAVGYYTMLPLRRVSVYNLKLALGVDTRKAKIISRRAFRNMALTFLETAYYKKKNKILKPYTVLGLDHLRRSLKKGKGVVLLTAHMGNWEFLGKYICEQDIKLAAIGRQIHNPYVDEWIVNARKHVGMETIYKSSEVSENRKIIRCLKNNYTIAFLADQYLTDGIKVPFFGVETKTASGPARIALLTKSPVHFAVCIHDGTSYTLEFTPEIKLSENPDKMEKIKEDTILFNSIIADSIRKNPDQWLSFHNRFKDYRREQKKKSRNP